MAILLPIPLVQLPLGTQTFGPVDAPVGIQQLHLDIDQTAGLLPLNSALASTSIDGILEVSYDGGITWPTWRPGPPATGLAAMYNGNGVLLAQMWCHSRVVGGTYVNDETGATFTRWQMTALLAQPTTQTSKVRGTLIVTGTPVTISGSLTLS